MNQIFQSEYNEEGKNLLYLENISKMIINRDLKNTNIDAWKELFEQFKNNFDNDSSFGEYDNNKIAIKLLSRKITTIRKVEDIDLFLDKFQSYYKFIVVFKITPKAYNQFLEIKNTEVFFEDELLTNKIDHILVPKHIPISPEEQEQIKNEYGFKRNEFGKIHQTDAIARYYNLKVGDIIAIERASNTSGYSLYYRMCIPSSLM